MPGTSRPSSASHPERAMPGHPLRSHPSGVDDDGLGFRFFLGLAGIALAVGVGGMIVFLIITRAVYAFGFLGGFLVFAAVLLAAGWLYDRRHERVRSEDSM